MEQQGHVEASMLLYGAADAWQHEFCIKAPVKHDQTAMLTRLPSVAAFHFKMIALCSPHILWIHCGLSSISVLLNSAGGKKPDKKQNYDVF